LLDAVESSPMLTSRVEQSIGPNLAVQHVHRFQSGILPGLERK
jgi:hypothetical protein